MSRYLVTGCAGFVGSHLSERLLERGDEVRGVDAFTDYYDRSVKEGNLERPGAATGFEFVEADLADAPLEPLLDGLDVIALRYFTVYGPRQRPDMAFTRIAQALAAGGRFTVLGTGEQSRDFTYVDDAVAATLLSMERGTAGAVYNVGGGQEASLREIIELGERLSGRALNVVNEPAAAGDVTRT